MRRSSFVVALILLFCAGGALSPGKALAAGPTYVQGEIRGEQVWSAQNSPYILTGDVTVASGGKLQIEKGTVVKAQRVSVSKPYTRRAVIRVHGELVVNGTRPEPVLFTGYEKGIYGSWGGIWIDGFRGGRGTFRWTEVEYAERGLYVSGAAVVVEDSKFSNNFTGIYLEASSGSDIQRTVVVSNEYGLYVDTSEVTATLNLFASNIWGIYSIGDSKAVISHNDVKSNTFGYTCDGGARDEVTYNDFSIRNRNDYALDIVSGAPAVLTNNNFFFDEAVLSDPGAIFWYIFNDSPTDVAAGGNWWDSTDEEFIANYICDGMDEAGRGLVTFRPFASGPIANTVDDIRAPLVSIISLTPLSPDGNGINDRATISYSLSEDAKALHFEVLDFDGVMGNSGQVVYSRVIDAAMEPDLVSDGEHEIQWDGEVTGGGIAPEGSYLVRMWADDKDDPQLVPEVVERFLEVDVTPPVLEITSPVGEVTVHSHELTLVGRVFDRAPTPQVRAKGQDAVLNQGNFSIEVELVPWVNQITVIARDWAGNESTADVIVRFEPVITLTVESPTNSSQQAVEGFVHSALGAQVKITLEDPAGFTRSYSAIYSGGEGGFTSEPVTLAVGRNKVTALLFDAQGKELGDNGAEIVFDPNVNQVLQFNFAAGLQMVGVPMWPNNGEHGAVLGQSSPKLARWQYSPGQGYVYYPDSRLEGFAPGRGFWLEGDSPLQGSIVGTIADPAKEACILLQPGWNQIANPFLVARDFEKDVQVKVEGRIYPMKTALDSGWIARGLWGYGNGYELAGTLEPWKGYWVRAGRALELVISPPNTVRSLIGKKSVAGIRSFTGKKPVTVELFFPGRVNESGGEWAVRLMAAYRSAADKDNWIGQRKGAGYGYDRDFDLLKPPPGPQGLELAVLGADRLGKPIRLAADFRELEPGKEETWVVVLETGEEEQEVTLTWQVSSVPDDCELYLVDGEKRVSMRKVSQYTVNTKGTRLMSVIARSGPGEQKVSDLFVYPNPLRAGRELAVRFHLQIAADIELLVYDVVGSLVYSRRVPALAGTNEVKWPGIANRGNRVANGLYYLVVKADGPGEKSQAAIRVGVVR